MELRAGDPCEPDGFFDQPMDVEFDSSNNFWVLEVGNNRLQKFDQHGTFISKFGTACVMNGAVPGSGGNGALCNDNAPGAVVDGDGQFYSPKDFAIDPSGNIWVADTNNNRIQKFDSSGTFLLKFGSEGCQVIQNDGRIGENGPNGSWINTDTHNGKFCNPVSIDFDSSGKVYVADHNNRRIQQFDSSGNYLTSFGSYGTTDGKFINPHFITLDSSDHIYVGDRERNNVQVFDDSFNFRYAITGLSDPKDIVVDLWNRLIVAYNHAVNVYTSSNSTAAASSTTLDFSNTYRYDIANFSGTQLSQITIPSGNGGASLDFSNDLNQTAADTTNKSITFPNRIVVNATATDTDVDVIIQSGTSVNGTNWDGNLELANNVDKSAISVSGQRINMATSFGSDRYDLTFTKPMRINFNGMGSQSLWYIDAAGTTQTARNLCLADSFSSAASSLGGRGICQISVGNDLIAYTYHFTKFFTSSDIPSSASSSSGGGKGSCDSNGFGKNNSLRVYEVSYDIESNQVQVQAYSTCGSIQTKMSTPTGQSVLGLSAEQPLLDDMITVYSGFLDESEEKFNISIQNKRDSFSETFYIHDKSISKSYTGETGYTSEQQGMTLPIITSKQTTIVSEPSVTQIVQTIEESIAIEEQILDEPLEAPKVQSIGYTPEPVAEKETMPQCGAGTKLVDGICKIIKTDEPKFCFLFWCW